MAQKSLEKQIQSIAQNAENAALNLVLLTTKAKNDALKEMAKALKNKESYIIKENKKDLLLAIQSKLSDALIDRLTLNQKRIDEMAQCLLDTAKLKDPIGEVLSTINRPNGLEIKKVRVPIGTIAVIYESRPNVTSDCIGLALKSGNAIILKGGKEAFFSNKAIYSVLKKSLKSNKILHKSIQFVDSIDRDATKILLKQDKYVDLIIPRGGESLIRFVAENSTIPVIKHYKGVCHTYVSDKANLKMASDICFNAKVQRPGVCNAMETMLVHKNIAKKFLPEIFERLSAAGVEIRGCKQTKQIIKNIKNANIQDWYEEYLDLMLAVKVVGSLEEAIAHINKYGSGHSDAIITNDKKQAESFLKSVDSACLYVNASTRFTDGYQFGFGAEVGISTDKLHARGPMALEELTTYKYLVYGKGQIRQ